MMGRRVHLCRTFVWIITVFIILQFFNYDWNIFSLQRLLRSDDRHEIIKLGSLRKLGPQKLARPVIGINLQEVKEEGNVDFRIIAMSYNRNASLQRLLNSLNNVDYMGCKVVLDIWIDRSKEGLIHEPTYLAAKNFQFRHGILKVHNHTRHAGIYGQWMDTWYPSAESSEIVVFLEDDLTVSPFLYKWLKNVHQKYDERSYIAGYALQGKSIKHGGGEGDLHAPDKNVCFLYPVMGSWGLSPRRENWMKFIEWYKKASLNQTFEPVVEIPGFLPTIWYKIFIKRGKTDGMWTMWYIYYTFSQKELFIYPNIIGHKGLTANWKETGLHFKKKKNAPDGPLLDAWDSRYDNLPNEPVQLDIKGRLRKQFG